ncbi:hypothetical protein BY458DRAFT_496033 [Sporodiniella umbellata]|nr:hypothetical protein BY458DRAFT_496033 [Sporodiniella umbellata]
MESATDTDIHGWLMNLDSHRSITNKARSLSIASISSEDSIDLDELININFTTSMEEETDLSDLALLDLDDSKEDFFKVDNAYTPSFGKKKVKPSYYIENSEINTSYSYSKQNMSYPTIRFNSSECSPSNHEAADSYYSQIRQSNRNIYPSKSTSTSSYDSQSTETSALSRTTLPLTQNTMRRKQEKEDNRLSVCVPESARLARPIPHASRRASHIPAPTSSISIFPQSTKSTIPTNAPRSLNRLPTRASHIPSPRSTTSLGLASLSTTSPPKILSRSKTNYLSPPS